MGCLNYEFFDEFKALDNLCRDIYGDSVDKKLGVTLYLEDMDRKAYQGAFKISGWGSDYNHLKAAKNIRNELAHSRNSITVDICSQVDIEFVRSFHNRILNQTDPIALLKQYMEQRGAVISNAQSKVKSANTHDNLCPEIQSKPTNAQNRRNRSTVRKFEIFAFSLAIGLCLLLILTIIILNSLRSMVG